MNRRLARRPAGEETAPRSMESRKLTRIRLNIPCSFGGNGWDCDMARAKSLLGENRRRTCAASEHAQTSLFVVTRGRFVEEMASRLEEQREAMKRR